LTVEPIEPGGGFTSGAGIVGSPAITAPTGRSSCIAGM
jgi:hypothetical protein